MHKQIGIFGGYFNPVTNGHIIIAQEVIKAMELDEVWFVPYINKLIKRLINIAHRKNMIELATKEFPNIKVNIIEYDMHFSDTIFVDLNLYLALMYKKMNYKFFTVIGQDAANDIHRLHNWEMITQLINFIVIPRKSYTSTTDWYLKGNHKFLENIEVPEVSSTELRKFLKYSEYDKAKELTPECVIEYIIKNKICVK